MMCNAQAKIKGLDKPPTGINLERIKSQQCPSLAVLELFLPLCPSFHELQVIYHDRLTLVTATLFYRFHFHGQGSH